MICSLDHCNPFQRVDNLFDPPGIDEGYYPCGTGSILGPFDTVSPGGDVGHYRICWEVPSAAGDPEGDMRADCATDEVFEVEEEASMKQTKDLKRFCLAFTSKFGSYSVLLDNEVIVCPLTDMIRENYQQRVHS